jgi:hypothetical protein
MSPSNGPTTTVSIVTPRKSFFMICLLLEATLSLPLPLKMPTLWMISLLEGPALVFFTSSIKILLNSSLSTRRPWKLPLTVQNESLLAFATEQIMDLGYTLQMMGAPRDGKAYMFGDNQSVITSGTIPHSSLINYTTVWLTIVFQRQFASDAIWFFHISGTINPADVLTKFLGQASFWPLLRPLLFWSGQPSQVKSS